MAVEDKGATAGEIGRGPGAAPGEVLGGARGSGGDARVKNVRMASMTAIRNVASLDIREPPIWLYVCLGTTTSYNGRNLQIYKNVGII